MENKKSSVALTVLGVCTLLVALVGATFAYFTATSTTTDQNVQTGKLLIQSSFGTTSQSNIKPTTFAVATADSTADIAKFTFGVTGTGTTVTGGTYDIVLTGVGVTGDDYSSEATNGTTEDIKYALYTGTAGASGTLVDSGDFTDITSGKTITPSSNSLDNNTSDSYTLYVYIEENSNNQNNLKNATISVSMQAVAKTPSPSA